MLLNNRINREILKENLKHEQFSRRTITFYKYGNIIDPLELRNTLYQEWHHMNCFGRIYIATEGINAQMSVPEHYLNKFLESLSKHHELKDVLVKYAVEDNGKSFYKLTIKVRQKIVADGLEEGSYDLSKTGTHLTPIEFHQNLDDPDTLVVDMRNHYESEVGKFFKAWCPEANTFKEAVQIVATEFQHQKNKKLLLYCTGGIRCEKASAYLIHHGFENVFQLSGGIIEYAKRIKENDLPSKFIGKNFVFDERLGKSITGEIISHCHQCGQSSDKHTNCANNDCHLLFIQCDACREKYEGCCSDDCKNIKSLPTGERKKFKILRHGKYASSKIFNKIRSVNE